MRPTDVLYVFHGRILANSPQSDTIKTRKNVFLKILLIQFKLCIFRCMVDAGYVALKGSFLLGIQSLILAKTEKFETKRFL